MKTNSDRREIARFKDFLRSVADGKSEREAYAEKYGEVIFEAEGTSDEPRNQDKTR